MRHWNFYYLIALGMAVLNLIFISIVFGFKTMDGKFCIIQLVQLRPVDRIRLPQAYR